MKTFGAETRYDWYVLKTGEKATTATIKDQNGTVHNIDINKWGFLPNADFELIEKLLAKPGDEKVEILFSRSMYGTDKKWMNQKSTDEHKYPCVYTVPKSGVPNLWYTNRKEDFFVPKVIWSTGRPISVGFYLDMAGEYGLTQFSTAIVDSKDNLPAIQSALDSRKFREFCSSISVGKLEINRHIIKFFRKDFWKEFI
jgi:hypothetical protein